jgi:hypothetical protein
MYYISINVQYVRYSTGRKIKYFIVIVYRYHLHQQQQQHLQQQLQQQQQQLWKK